MVHAWTDDFRAQMTAASDITPPRGRPLRARLSGDDWVMRGYMAVIAIYLVIALALPLYTMLSKAFLTYSFDLTQFEFQVSDADGQFTTPPITAAAINETTALVPPEDLASSSDGRLAATSFFPDFSFRGPGDLPPARHEADARLPHRQRTRRRHRVASSSTRTPSAASRSAPKRRAASPTSRPISRRPRSSARSRTRSSSRWSARSSP